MKRLTIYNTLKRKKEEFVPISDPKVGMYVCGITPYGESHLGHARCYIVFDAFKRYLGFLGYDVTYIQNITDIDDKIINKSRETGMSPRQISEKYFISFSDSMKKLNVLPADSYPKVSGSIDDIVEFIRGLIDKDAAYAVDGNVYFRVNKLADYGKLSGRDPAELISKQEIDTNEKEDTRDFAVWKKDPEFGWESPWGLGRPGWHIECSAMARRYLGDQFDIHGGGLDLIFPHHENEIAQSKALTGKEPVRYWIHNGMVTLKGDKMAKSTGNFFLLKELLSEYDPMVLRMYLLSSGYRQVIDFSSEGIADTGKAYDKLVELKKELYEVDSAHVQADPADSYLVEIIDSLNDDFNTARGLGEIFKKAAPVREKIFAGSYGREDIESGKKLLYLVENILGVLLDREENIDPDKIEELIRGRDDARLHRDFATADRIRDELAGMGIELKDTPAGTKWHKKT